MATVREEVNSVVEQLPPHQQQKVLEFAQELAELHRLIASLPKTPLPPGIPGSALLRFKLPREAAEAMAHALEECEREVFVAVAGVVVPGWRNGLGSVSIRLA